jgi:hypothetical protein
MIPDSSTAGTPLPSYTSGRGVDGQKAIHKRVLVRRIRTSATLRTMASINVMAGSSPPDNTKSMEFPRHLAPYQALIDTFITTWTTISTLAVAPAAPRPSGLASHPAETYTTLWVSLCRPRRRRRASPIAASSGSANITIPGPPRSLSSTVRWLSMVKSRGFHKCNCRNPSSSARRVSVFCYRVKHRREKR